MKWWLVPVLLCATTIGCAAESGRRAPLVAGDDVLAAVERHAQAFTNRDMGELLAGVAPDIEWYSIEAEDVTLELRGREALRDAMLTYFAETPTFESRIEDAVISGAFVSVRERASWQGASGPKSQTAIGVFEVRDGLIRRVWYYPAQR